EGGEKGGNAGPTPMGPAPAPGHNGSPAAAAAPAGATFPSSHRLSMSSPDACTKTTPPHTTTKTSSIPSRMRLLNGPATPQKPRRQTKVPPPLQIPPKQKLTAISSSSY